MAANRFCRRSSTTRRSTRRVPLTSAHRSPVFSRRRGRDRIVKSSGRAPAVNSSKLTGVDAPAKAFARVVDRSQGLPADILQKIDIDPVSARIDHAFDRSDAPCSRATSVDPIWVNNRAASNDKPVAKGTKMWIPVDPEVLGNSCSPTVSSSSRIQSAMSVTRSKATPSKGSRSNATSTTSSGVVARENQGSRCITKGRPASVGNSRGATKT